MGRTILLLSPLKKGSGNNSTIQRIRSYFEGNDKYICIVKDPGNINESCVNQLISQSNVKAVLAIHAYRSGRLLTDCNVPVILILGGTDINEFYQEEDKLQIMTQVVTKSRRLVYFNLIRDSHVADVACKPGGAHSSGAPDLTSMLEVQLCTLYCHYMSNDFFKLGFIVAFSTEMAERAKNLWSFLKDDKLIVIKQAVITTPSSFSLLSHLQSHNVISCTDDVKIFVIVGAIRPVKNPLYIVKEVSEWHNTRKDVVLVIIGPETDPEYQKYFTESISGLSGVFYIPGLSSRDAHAAIKESFALVNTSESEGMAVTILEAMQMGVPVLARDNSGNRSLIQDDVTGFIFNSPEMFKEKANLLLENTDLKSKIVSNAADYVNKHHSTAVEKEMYLKLVSDIVCKGHSIQEKLYLSF